MYKHFCAIVMIATVVLLAPLSSADTVPNTYMYGADGGTEFNGALYLFFTQYTQFNDTFTTYYSYTYGSTWSPRVSVPIPTNPVSYARVDSLTPVTFNGRLYIFWYGATSDASAIKYMSMDAFGNWSAVATIPNAFADGGVGAAVFNGRLYAMWRATGGNTSLFYNSMSTAGTWNSNARLSTGESAYSPAAAVIRMADGVQYLYAFWMDRNFGAQPMWYARMAPGAGWSTTTKIATADYPLTSRGPSVSSSGSRIDLVYKGGYDDTLYLKKFSDTASWLPELETGYTESHAPVSVWYNGATWIFHDLDYPNYEIYYSLHY
ncbi:MAG TPA: hypothetical protein VM733_18075 [Thermoanaerobaculia bacterium]|nr:hypothetical protein [Thermoanaerobaculia bacterium]